MNRREFTRTAALVGMALQTFPFQTSMGATYKGSHEKSRVPLGFCNYALRGKRLKAEKLIEYAIKHHLDAVQFNTLAAFESLDEKHLVSLKNLASEHSIRIYVGAGSICSTSVQFKENLGSPADQVKEGIRVARAVYSPILGVRIGNIRDRYTHGGIKPKIDEVVEVMRSMRGPALEAGIKFAFENHSGDMRTSELLELIERTGTDICGAFFDTGNAIYAMEDPMAAMEVLGKHILCTSIRDVRVWATDEGATYQWTAVGEGMMDYPRVTKFMAENCPGVPLVVETISNMQRSIDFLKPKFWEGWPDLKASEMTEFLKLVKQGIPMRIEKPPAWMDQKEFDIRHQEEELQKSLTYLREHCGAGIKRR